MTKRFYGPVGQAVLFFAITFSWMWVFWIAAALVGQPADSTVTI